MTAADVLPPASGPGDANQSPTAAPRSGSFWGDVLRRLRRNPAAWAGAVVVGLLGRRPKAAARAVGPEGWLSTGVWGAVGADGVLRLGEAAGDEASLPRAASGRWR